MHSAPQEASKPTVATVADLLQIAEAGTLCDELTKEVVKMGSETVPKRLNKRKAQQVRVRVTPACACHAACARHACMRMPQQQVRMRGAARASCYQDYRRAVLSELRQPP